MAQTAIDVEVQKTTPDHDIPLTITPAFEEQNLRRQKTSFFAPLALLATGFAAFLVVRRWLHHNGRLI